MFNHDDNHTEHGSDHHDAHGATHHGDHEQTAGDTLSGIGHELKKDAEATADDVKDMVGSEEHSHHDSEEKTDM